MNYNPVRYKQMKKPLKILFVCLTVSLSAAQAFAQLSYEIDVGQNRIFETGGLFHVDPEGPNVKVDFYIDNYSCPPNDKLWGVETYISLDANQCSVVDCYAFNSVHGGPFALGGCTMKESNVYFIHAGCS
jgi:hypothetical protein